MSIFDRLRNRNRGPQVNGIFSDIPDQSEPVTATQKTIMKSKSKNQTKASSMNAVELELIGNAEKTAVLGFGLRWRSLIGANSKEAALKIALGAKGTHYLFRSQQVGYGILPKHTDAAVYPAALLAAKMHAGAAVFALSLGEGQYWFALVRSGKPSNTDEVISGLQDAQAVARVRSLVAQFEGETIAVFSDIQNSGIDGQKSFRLRDLFDVVRTDEDKLQRPPAKKSSIPKPVMYAVGVAIVILGGQRGYSEWREYETRKAQAANQVNEQSPEAAWAPVVARFFSSTPKPGPGALVEVRKSLSDMPVVWSGWAMTGARCQAAPELSAQSTRAWSCQGSYLRGRIADTSEQILKKAQNRYKDRQIAFPNITTMTVAWSVVTTERPLEVADLIDPGTITIEVASHLQGYFPVFSQQPDFSMAAFELPAPKRSDGQPHPKPATVPNLYEGKVLLKGPLRTMDTMSKQLTRVQWDSLGMVVDTNSSPDQKGLTTSSINVELAGKAFGKK